MDPLCPWRLKEISLPIVFEESNSLVQIALPTAVVVVSLLALIVSLWTLRVQRTHNRKSVRPAGHVQLRDSPQGLQVWIVNKGCGPMFIKELVARRNGKVEHNLIYHLPNGILNGYTHEFHTEPEGYWLAPGDKLVLLSLEGNHADKGFVKVRERVRAVLKDTVLQLVFCDVYDDIHPMFEKSLSWYERDLESTRHPPDR